MRRTARRIAAGLVTAAIVAVGLVAPAGVAGADPVAAAAPLPQSYQDFLASVGGSRYVDVDGVRMHYVEAGDTSRPVLLLLHGSPDNVFAWRDVMPELARSYHVIAPDLVGFGQSGKPAGHLTWSTEIRYLSAFIAAEDLRDVTLVVTDIGGLFGFSYAATHPDNVAGIALWETVTAPIPSYDVLGSYCPDCVGFFQTPKDPTLRKTYIIDNADFAEQVYGGTGLIDPLSGDELAGYGYFLATPDQRRSVADIGANMPIGGVPAVNNAIAAQFARYLRVSAVPKLVLYADPGSILPGATAIGLGTPNTSYVSVGSGYHYLVEDAPAAIVAALLQWRAGVGDA